MRRLLAEVGRTAIDLALPATCALCGMAGDWLCGQCAGKLPASREPLLDWPGTRFRCEFCERCRRCDQCAQCRLWRDGRPITREHVEECPICRFPCRRCEASLKRENEEQAACPECGARRVTACGPQYFPPQLLLLRSSFRYAGTAEGAILALKYQGVRKLAEPLVGAVPAARLPNRSGLDVIVPIPMKARDRRRRGGNHAEAIAAALGARIGAPVNRGLLTRSKKRTVRQATITGGSNGGDDVEAVERRWANVQDAFEVPDRVAAGVAGSRVLLVDDVATTTATLQSAAIELRAAGARSVNAWALARREAERAGLFDDGEGDEFE